MNEIHVQKEKKCADKGRDHKQHAYSSINVLKTRRLSPKSSEYKRKVNKRSKELFDLDIVP